MNQHGMNQHTPAVVLTDTALAYLLRNAQLAPTITIAVRDQQIELVRAA